ncbi:hypothetical protein [Flavobacterium sp. U410]
MIKNNLKLALYLLTGTFFSCGSLTKDDVYGNYEYNSKISKGSLVLSKDYFEYSYEAPMESYESKGNWSFNNNRLLLKSYENYKNNFIIVEEVLDENKRFVRLIDDTDAPIIGATVIINSDLIFQTNEFGEINLKDNKINNILKIEVELIDLLKEDRVYIPNDKISKSFIIKDIPKDYKKVFFNDSMRIDKNKVIIFNQEYIKNNN